jgi:phage shock protein A
VSMWTSFFGERAGRALQAQWNAFIGRAGDGNTAVSIEQMRLAETEIAQTVACQQTAVAEFMAFADESEQLFQAKLSEDEQLTREARAAAQRGNPDAAKALLVKARSVRGILEPLKVRAESARANADSARAELAFHKQELDELQADLKNHEDLQRLDEAQRKVNKAKASFSTDSAKRAYDKSAESVRHSALTSVAESQLLDDPNKKALYNARQQALSSDLDAELALLLAPPPELKRLDTPA